MTESNGTSSNRLRILLVSHGLPPEDMGGVELYTLRLARLLARDHDVVLAVPDRRPRPEKDLSFEDRPEGFRVAWIKAHRSKKKFLDMYVDEEVDRVFERLLDEFRPDVVHVHHILYLSTGILTCPGKRGIPVLLTLHDFWLNCPRGQRITEDGTVCTTIDRERCVTCLNPQWDGIHRDPLAAPRRILLNLLQGKERAREELRAFDRHMREVLSRVDRLVSPSRSMLADFVVYGADPKKTVRLRYCLEGDPKESKEQRKANGRSRSRSREEGGKLRIGYLGTLIPTKGVHVLTEAYRSLKDLPVTLDIHGTAPPFRGRQDYVGQLEKSVRDLGGVRFRGPYEQSALPEILKELDVVVVPSVWMENFPQTALEALTAGVPVVAADHGGLAEIVRTGVNGLKFRPGDALDLAQKLRQLVDDPGLHRRLCGRGVDIPKPDEHAAAHVGLYREVVKEKAEKAKA